MKKIALLFGICFSVGLFAQETAKEALIELQANFYEKKFSKKWEKKKQAEWEAICADALTMDELNKSFNEWSDMMAQTISFSMGNSDFQTELEFIEYLLKVEETIPSEYKSNWAEEDQVYWREGLTDFIAAENEKKKKADQMARFQKMTGIVKDFSNKFPTLWEDSKKNAFANSEGASVKGGSDIQITKDQYGVASFSVFFDTDGDAQMAKKLMEELMTIIEENVGDGYQQGNDMDASYTGSIKKTYQFEGEKFAETAKKPTVEIGTLKDTPGVMVVITEPVFGH
jgi:hypothetical protein